jgi:hypothetical protein
VKIIHHPDHYKDGTRVLMLKSRHKDGVEKQRTILRVSRSAAEFDAQITSLASIMQPNERLYATAGPRDVRVAMRLFQERQLQAHYDVAPENFYFSLESRWVSCLMDPKAQDGKMWMLDCDSEEDRTKALAEHKAIVEAGLTYDPYIYATKSGTHIICAPFDRTLLSERVRGMLHDNPLMLWAYS